jgi:hypothetical protein
VTAASAAVLREALHPLLVDAGWTPTEGHTLLDRRFRRADMELLIGYRELDLMEVPADESPDGPIEVLHAVVSTVGQAIGHLRACGALPAAEPVTNVAYLDLLGFTAATLRGSADITGADAELRALVVQAATAETSDAGWRSPPPCILCGDPAVRGFRHCPECQDILGHTVPAVTA